MGNYRSHHGSKSQNGSGISAAEAAQLRSRIEHLEKTVRDSLAEKNQWNSMVRGWVGKTICISLTMPEEMIEGELLWVDRYTLCLKVPESEHDTLGGTPKGGIVIVHKGSVAYLYVEEPDDEP